MSVTVDPPTIQLTGAPATITVSAEVPGNVANRLDADVVEGACPASKFPRPSGSWDLLLRNPFPEAPVNDSFRFSADRVGSFSVCAYLDPGDGPPQTASAPLTVTLAGGSIALAPTLRVVTRARWREQIPQLGVVATGAADAAGELFVYAIRDGKTCARQPDDRGVLKLEPDRPARTNREVAIVAAGAFSQRFRAEDAALNAQKGPTMLNPVTLRPDHWSGTARYRVCATLTYPESPLANERVDGPGSIPAFVFAQAAATTSVTIKPLPPRVLGVVRWNGGSPSVEITFRGCRDDVHVFRGIRLKGHSFRERLRFADGRVGRLRGRFNTSFRKVSGRVFVPRCKTIRFTRRGRF